MRHVLLNYRTLGVSHAVQCFLRVFSCVCVLKVGSCRFGLTCLLCIGCLLLCLLIKQTNN